MYVCSVYYNVNAYAGSGEREGVSSSLGEIVVPPFSSSSVSTSLLWWYHDGDDVAYRQKFASFWRAAVAVRAWLCGAHIVLSGQNDRIVDEPWQLGLVVEVDEEVLSQVAALSWVVV
jgi:hypothetical protein